MNSVVTFKMECGHDGDAAMDRITLIMFCGNAYCLTNRKVIAIETREWFFKCGGCRFGRYTGQSKADAEYRLNFHVNNMQHKNGEVWYRRVPEKSEFVRDLFGRSVKDTISEPRQVLPDKPVMQKRFVHDVPLPDGKVPF